MSLEVSAESVWTVTGAQSWMQRIQDFKIQENNCTQHMAENIQSTPLHTH